MIRINKEEYNYNGDIKGVFNNFTVRKGDCIKTERGEYFVENHWRTWEDRIRLRNGYAVNVYKVIDKIKGGHFYYGRLFGCNTYYKLSSREVEKALGI